jgi:hypothetical protein
MHRVGLGRNSRVTNMDPNVADNQTRDDHRFAPPMRHIARVGQGLTVIFVHPDSAGPTNPSSFHHAGR